MSLALCLAERLAALKAIKEGRHPPPLSPPEPSTNHGLLVHRVHSADPEDPWLQREWGEVLVAEKRYKDAAVHFEAGFLAQATPHGLRYTVAQWPKAISME